MRLLAVLRLLGVALATSNARESFQSVERGQRSTSGSLMSGSFSALDANSRLRRRTMDGATVNLLRRQSLGSSAGSSILDKLARSRRGHGHGDLVSTAQLMPDSDGPENQNSPAEVLPEVRKLERDAEKEIADTKEEVVEDVTMKLKQAKDGPTNATGKCLGATVCIFIIACVVLVSLADHWQPKEGKSQRVGGKLLADDGSPASPASPASPRSKGWFQTMDAPTLSEEFNSVLEGITLNNLPGNFGLSAKGVESNLATYGLNKMTPPVKPSAVWLLMKQVFGGVFNSLLWFCVTVEVALASFMGADESDLVTPAILATVITMAGALQWWTEQQAEQQMCSLQQMQSAEHVAVCRHGVFDEIPSEHLLPGAPTVTNLHKLRIYNTCQYV